MWERSCECCGQLFGTPSAYEEHLKSCTPTPNTDPAFQAAYDELMDHRGRFTIERLQAAIRVYERARREALPAERLERAAEEVYEAMRWAIMRAPYHDETPPKWQEGGNSLAQDRARQVALAALQQPEQSATPQQCEAKP